jgi:hypothetical protein
MKNQKLSEVNQYPSLNGSFHSVALEAPRARKEQSDAHEREVCHRSVFHNNAGICSALAP